MAAARNRKGMLTSVAGMPFALVRGGVGLVRGAVSGGGSGEPVPQDSLADQWIDFLVQQAEAAEAADAAGQQRPGNGSTGTLLSGPSRRKPFVSWAFAFSLLFFSARLAVLAVS